MRITDLRAERGGGRIRAAARWVWEASPRAPDEVWVETDEAYGAGFGLRPETFLLPALVAAMKRGERRVVVEGSLCSVLARNLPAALRTLRAWEPALVPPAVEATGGTSALEPAPGGVVATAFSGGADAFAAVRTSRLDLPASHPRSVRVGFFVLGMNSNDLRGAEVDPARRADFEARLARFRPVAEAVGVEIVPVASNLRSTATSFPSWAHRTQGAFLAGVAHAFAGRVARMRLPSTGATDPMDPGGCHPLLDPFWSSGAVGVESDGAGMTRVEKLRLLAGWPEALAVLQPCQQHALRTPYPNCGRCNKCHRTIVALEAIGALAGATSFPPTTVDVAFVEGLVVVNEVDAQCHDECVGLFRAAGRPDLARALERRVAAWRRRRRWRALRRAMTGRSKPPGAT